MKLFFGAIVMAALMFGVFYIQWWSCGERFPNGQFACFITGK